jgi:type II secretory pathway pseudopilin PulG
MNYQRGITLLETMLTLVIGTSILVMGLKMYQQYQLDTNLQQLQYNVRLLSVAMANYYHANCQNYGTLDPTSAGRPTSAPAIPSLTTPWPINVTTQLVTPGFLGKWPLILNPLIDTTVGANGYILQLNPILSTTPPNITGCTDTKVPCTVTATPLPTTQSIVLVWQLQVAIKLHDQTKNQSYIGTLGASCLSDLGSGGNTVTPCSSAVTSNGTYIVWDTLPSFIPNMNSVLTPSMSILKQESLLYTHDVMYELNSGYTSPQYYLCGG